MIYFVFLASVLGQQSPWYMNYDGAIIELTGQNPSVVYGPLDASDSLTLTRNASEDKLVCSGEFEAADLRIAGSSTTVADLIGEVAALRLEMAAVKAFVGMMPPPAMPPPNLPSPSLPPCTTSSLLWVGGCPNHLSLPGKTGHDGFSLQQCADACAVDGCIHFEHIDDGRARSCWTYGGACDQPDVVANAWHIYQLDCTPA